MGNPLLGQILGGVFGSAMGRRGMGGGLGGLGGMGRGGLGGMGGLGGGLGGAALGSILGGMLGGRRSPMGRGGMGGLGGGRSALLMLMLPMAMRWVQNNGGMGAVLKRFQQKGYDRQAQSWVATGDNEDIDEQAVQQVVGRDEISQMAQQLGVPEQEAAQAFAEIMPEMVNQLTPNGQLSADADGVLEDGRSEFERELEQAQKQSA